MLMPSIVKSEISSAKTEGELRKNSESRSTSSFFIIEFFEPEVNSTTEISQKYSI